MIATILIGALLQTTALRPEVWKERNQPDMPVLPKCNLGEGTTIARSIKALPVDVASELTQFFGPEMPMSDAGGPFNNTDVVGGNVPQRRFLRGYQSGSYWVIWYERGGRVSGPRTIALRRDRASRHGAARFRMTPGTIFAGDLCVATRAILSGVRTGGA